VSPSQLATFAASIRVPQSQSAIQGASERQEEAQQGGLIRDSDEWIKGQSDGKKIDLIVVGTRGRSGIGKFVLGSGAEEIFR
jgi:nucleotide-binding universal stress UspA family protein